MKCKIVKDNILKFMFDNIECPVHVQHKTFSFILFVYRLTLKLQTIFSYEIQISRNIFQQN